MLKRRFDPMKPLLVVLYLRMSSDDQNPRSPQQQQDTIEATLRRLGYPWTVVRVYADEGVSGRYMRRRPGFQNMLRDIRTGAVKADAILVDTFERFGRADELSALRQELHQHHGVLILTADSQFADPTSVPGKALAAFESLRATEDNRVKAHNVLRGKRDAARQGHWPGGPPPFGYKLRSGTAGRKSITASWSRPRRTVRRRVSADDGSQAELHAMAHEAADVNRFAGLGLEWFWEDTLQIPGKTCWSVEHAQQVAAKRQETGWSPTKLAEFFRVSAPTIRKALQIAKGKDAQGNNGNQPPA